MADETSTGWADAGEARVRWGRKLFYVYPEDKQGKTKRVRIIQETLTVKCPAGVMRVYRRLPQRTDGGTPLVLYRDIQDGDAGRRLYEADVTRVVVVVGKLPPADAAAAVAALYAKL